MEWMVIVFIVVVIAYTVSLVKEFREKAREVEAHLLQIESQKIELEGKIQECEEERSEINVTLEEAKQAVKELQATADQRLARVNQHKKEMERRGKYRL